MAFMSYYNVLRYEKDPARRRVYASSFRRYWELERPERNPLFHFLYAAVTRGDKWVDPFEETDLTADGPWLEDSLDSLRRYPLDRFDWALSNSHRLDVVRLPWGADRGGGRGCRADGKVLPIDERYVDHWNHDPWDLDHGGEGRYLADGASFLLPYYLGLHHGFLAGE
jgi:hypothetical protein